MNTAEARLTFTIPEEVSRITSTLRNAHFEAYLVGGCVRDLMLGKKPKDWDVTTNATPEQIIPLFPHTFYENNFGTVGVVVDETEDETLKTIEVTTYRLESGYSDGRRPDEVSFSTNLKDDLARRDFTINAFAFDEDKGQLVDLYNGQIDLSSKTLRAVGEAEERFNEDGLRILRAIRLAAELDFTIEPTTKAAIIARAPILEKISKERIRDEFMKILMSSQPKKGIELAHELGVLKYISDELERGIGVAQNQAHSFDVWEHNLRTLQHAADKEWPLHIRLAALFHDVSKPETREWSKEKNDWTFYGHDVVGARVVKKALTALKFSNDIIDQVTKLVRWHMFFSDTEQISLSAVRRLIRNVGEANVWDLMDVRVCDRIGTGRPKENPYRLRKYRSMVEEALRDPVSVGMLKIDGNRIIQVTETPPGPKIGYILHALLEEVFEDPKLNNEKYLETRAKELITLPLEELKLLGEKGKEKKEEEEEKNLQEIRKRHWVK